MPRAAEEEATQTQAEAAEEKDLLVQDMGQAMEVMNSLCGVVQSDVFLILEK